jgi:4'-phosphopantetheinyl transferase
MPSELPARAPGPETLGEGEIHLWSIPLDPPAHLLDELGRSLSPDEWERARRFRFEIHRRRFIAGRGSLRALLAAYLGERPAALAFAYGDRGKPDLAGDPWLRFNLSHSEDLGLLGLVRGRPLGVDVEYRKEMSDLEQIASRFFSASENADLARVPTAGKKEAFFNCWTRKEAYLKAVGVGLAAPLDSFVVTLVPGEEPRMLSLEGDRERAARWFYHHLEPAPGYVGALAIEGEPIEGEKGEGSGWRISSWRFVP